MRRAFVLVHRYVGLVMAGFLVIAGLTGSLLAFNDELDAAISPELFRSAPRTLGDSPLDPIALRQRVAAHFPDAQVNRVPLRIVPGHAVRFPLQGRARAADNEAFVNPYTGAVQGTRRFADLSQGMKNLMPFIFHLHGTLALDQAGRLAFGIIALLWTIDCFVGAYLTFPQRAQKQPAAPISTWLRRWWPAWKVRQQSNFAKLNFDLHRAGGLWLWAMLFVLAWSSVSFNLHDVYSPVMRSLFEHQSYGAEAPRLARPQHEPGIAWSEAREIGRKLMADQGRTHGYEIHFEDALSYDPRRAIYRYDAHTDRDLRDHSGRTRLWFDANTGKFLGIWIPTGAARGDTIHDWLTSLHMAAIWGLPFKAFMAVVGLIVTMLSTTGIIIWWRKRTARRLAAAQRNTWQRARAPA